MWMQFPQALRKVAVSAARTHQNFSDGTERAFRPVDLVDRSPTRPRIDTLRAICGKSRCETELAACSSVSKPAAAPAGNDLWV